MSILDNLAGKPLIEADQPLEESLFEFTETDRTEAEIRTRIHERFGIQIFNPNIIEPDRFHQAYAHLLPEGFSFDPDMVESVRVYYDDAETEFAVVPFQETGIGVFTFRVSQNHSDHHLIPTALLLNYDSGKMAA